ncbi:MAG: tRNA (5-methylaminomethyl-2-thiouridine)(34)-methyltransferase MnmD [Bacteroidales bacterium]
MDRIIEETADGSATIYIPAMDEHYHSVKGALAESEHIFRDSALLHHPNEHLRVFEVGFGTGLNCVVTAMTGGKCVDYFTVERYPLSKDILNALRYEQLLGTKGAELFHAIHTAQWEREVAITDSFHLNKLETDFTADSYTMPEGIDIVYFDAFAPEKQPEMWSEAIFHKLYNAMSPNAILTTYCAKGEIRRRLQSIGFTVERIAGPVGGKREILRATKLPK